MDWQEYAGQDIFVYDDFNYSRNKIEDMLKAFDPHNLTSVSARYKNKLFIGDTIFVCTNTPKEVLITIRKAVDASPELRSKKELIETFINGINDVDDIMYEWHDYVVEMREKELVIIIEEERLKPVETRKFLENAFREGEVKTVGTDIDKIMPPVSRFGGGNRAAKKKTVIDRLKAYFDKFYGIGGNVKFTKEEEKS